MDDCTRGLGGGGTVACSTRGMMEGGIEKQT